jgi:hypothetical protein
VDGLSEGVHNLERRGAIEPVGDLIHE